MNNTINISCSNTIFYLILRTPDTTFRILKYFFYLNKAHNWFINFNPIQDGSLRGCSRMSRGVKRPPPPKILSYIFYNDEAWQNYTWLKADRKNIWITWHTPWALLTSKFFWLENSKFCNIKKCWYKLHFNP